MPRVTIKTGLAGSGGREEQLSEFFCDEPGCPNIATHVVGVVKDCGLAVILCDEHAIARGVFTPVTKRTANEIE